VPEITTPRIEAYIEGRLAEGAANATINRELSALKRMLKLGAMQTPPIVNRVPHLPMLKENNIRKGFFEHGEFIALRSALPSYLKGFATFAYKTGWRVSEIAGLKWNQVDLDNSIVRIEPGEAKNDEGRTVYLDDELKAIFNQQWEARKSSSKLISYVFPNKSGNGTIQNLRKIWNTACRTVGIGYGYKVSKRYVEKWEDNLPSGPTIHDFRRSACRNMVRSGISERIAMKVSGHKTRSVFDRYDIVNDADLKLAAQKQEAYLQTQKDTIPSTIHNFHEKRS
jgi:integrase